VFAQIAEEVETGLIRVVRLNEVVYVLGIAYLWGTDLA
jgi:hypothetical protein